jgi:WD40 repeat protein
MSQLAHLLSHWTQCLPQTHMCLIQCVYKHISNLTPPTYRVESAGSGTILSHCTKHELQTWLKTHKLFLGHGGARITNIAHIPSLFKGPIVAVKKVFQGKLHKTLKTQSKEITCVDWHPSGIFFAGGIHDRLLTLEIENDNAIKMWTKDGDLLQTLRGHTKGVLSVAWSPDGQTYTNVQLMAIYGRFFLNSELVKHCPSTNFLSTSRMSSFSMDEGILAKKVVDCDLQSGLESHQF